MNVKLDGWERTENPARSSTIKNSNKKVSFEETVFLVWENPILRIPQEFTSQRVVTYSSRSTINRLHAQFIAFIYSRIIILNQLPFRIFRIISKSVSRGISNHFARIILNHESFRIPNAFESFRIILNQNHFEIKVESFRGVMERGLIESFRIISESFWIILNHFESNFETISNHLVNHLKNHFENDPTGAKWMPKWCQNGATFMVPKWCLNSKIMKMVPSRNSLNVVPSAV